MKFLGVSLLFCVASAVAGQNNVEDIGDQREQYLIDIENFNAEEDLFEYILPQIDEENDIDASSRLWFAGWQARKELRKIQKQMPCGFPTYGIPPLAPFTKEEIIFVLKKYFIDTVTDFIHLRIDGLDKFVINKFSIGVIFKTVKFDFTFRELRFRSKYYTDTFVDLMQQLGFDVRYEGEGSVDFSLKHLQIKGSFKYKMPMFWGSMKIYKFNCVVTLRDCDSDIQIGLLSTGVLSRKFNNMIEKAVLSSINDNQKEISDKIEEMVVPRVNAVLKGHKIWYLFSLLGGGFGNTGSKCVPSPEPWYN
ncbi:hypothetical protein ACFFRR_005214 [Megaselia abdita]